MISSAYNSDKSVTVGLESLTCREAAIDPRLDQVGRPCVEPVPELSNGLKHNGVLRGDHIENTVQRPTKRATRRHQSHYPLRRLA